jgi:hypothetical protein
LRGGESPTREVEEGEAVSHFVDRTSGELDGNGRDRSAGKAKKKGARIGLNRTSDFLGLSTHLTTMMATRKKAMKRGVRMVIIADVKERKG